jgi:hypothetical protein
MAAQYSPGDRITVRLVDGNVEGTVWSYGPHDASYWVIPDRAVPGMIQGCIEVPLQLMEEIAGDTLW